LHGSGVLLVQKYKRKTKSMWDFAIFHKVLILWAKVLKLSLFLSPNRKINEVKYQFERK